MFDDLEQKNMPTEANSGEQNNNVQLEVASTPAPAPTAPASSQPGKVEDIFSETEKPEVFKPKQIPTAAVNTPPGEEKGSSLKKIIILIVIILALALFVWAMFLVFKYVSSSLEEKSNEPPIVEETFLPPEIFVDENEPPVINNNLDNIDGANPIIPGIDNLDDQIDVPPVAIQIMDSDQDGLSDENEYLLGTDINSVDTDIDGLFDREEVEVYKTNPLDADTDGDGFSDGDEVRGGYNPNGPGKLYEIEIDPNISE